MNILIFILIFVSLYTILNQNTKNKKMHKILSQRYGNSVTGLGLIINKIADFIEPYISLDTLKKDKLSQDLENLGIDITPTRYYAKNIAECILYSSIAGYLIAMSLGFSFGVLIFAAVFIERYTSMNKVLKKKLSDRSFAIEKQLVEFTSNVYENLAYTKNVHTILENYKNISTGFLSSELTLVLNTAKTSNMADALDMFDRRVNSYRLSSVIKGLKSVDRGIDQREYFDRLIYDNVSFQNELIKKEGQRRLEKLKPNVLMLLAVLGIMAFAMLLIVATGAFTEIF